MLRGVPIDREKDGIVGTVYIKAKDASAKVFWNILFRGILE
jgi:hypothetical protein